MAEELNSRILREKANSLWPDRFPGYDGLALRVHRALSWIERAERETEDLDAKCIFYWIAFNAAYARDLPSNRDATERDNLREYFAKIVALDSDNKIYNVVWNIYSGPIRLLLDNRYVFQPFWDYHNGKLAHDTWENRFQGERRRLNRALKNMDTETVLSTLFNRLYVLRNQLVHGGATWNSSLNRDQVTDGANILGALIPVMVDIMVDNRDESWGPPFYPRTVP